MRKSRAEYQRQWYLLNRDRVLEHRREYHRLLSQTDAARKTAKAWRIANAERLKNLWRERGRANYLADPEGYKRRAAAWAAAHPERRRAIVAKSDAKHSDQRRAYSSAWTTANPEANRAKEALRRGRSRGAAGVHTAADLLARWSMWGGRCWMCGAMATCTDHVKPLAKGGSNWPANLRPACKLCNSRKQAMWPYLAPMGQAWVA